jgi:hypothetical protein
LADGLGSIPSLNCAGSRLKRSPDITQFEVIGSEGFVDYAALVPANL